MDDATAAPLSHITELLTERYGDAGREAAQRLAAWLEGDVPYVDTGVLRAHLAEPHVDLLFDAFWQILPFGTGGRRGAVGYGPNRLNPTTVALTVQGHCDHLRRRFPDRADLTVVVANDVRRFQDSRATYRFLGDRHPLLGLTSRALARLSARIYAGNGIACWMPDPNADDAVLTTPELAYLIRERGASGGVNLSASHNPPDDNGIKVYDEHGSQPVAPDDQHLSDAINAVATVRAEDFAAALANGLIRAVPESAHRTYLDLYAESYAATAAAAPAAPVVYTPLNGCGLTSAGGVLRRVGCEVHTPPAEGPDGGFPAIPLRAPNPEVPQATGPAKAYAEEVGAGLVLATDPDADRVGVEVRLESGSWYHFDGNQIATVLAYYLMLDPDGPRRHGLVVTTAVTTRALRVIAERAGGQAVDDLLVGCKYIAHVLKSLDEGGRYGAVTASADDLVLGAEESHGVIMTPRILDKDAAPACMYVAYLHGRERAAGRTLFDYYLRIVEELGAFLSVGRSITLVGAEGLRKKDALMASLRAEPPAELAGRRVDEVVDHWDEQAFGRFVSETDRAPRNLVELVSEGLTVAARPSGTEPKLKFYCQLLPTAAPPAGASGRDLLAAAEAECEAAARAVYRELLGRIGVRLDDAALALPDIIDLSRKLDFQERVAGELRQVVDDGKSVDDALAWLGREAAPMLPGADPLPALKGAVRVLCERWTDELADSASLGELKTWASSG